MLGSCRIDALWCSRWQHASLKLVCNWRRRRRRRRRRRSASRHTCCVSFQSLHHSEELFKVNYMAMPCEGFPNSKAPANAPSFPSFWRMHRYEKILTSRCVDHHNRDVRVKHLVTQPGNAPKARPSHLTTADKVNKVSTKTTKFGSFRGCRA